MARPSRSPGRERCGLPGTPGAAEQAEEVPTDDVEVDPRSSVRRRRTSQDSQMGRESQKTDAGDFGRRGSPTPAGLLPKQKPESP